MSSAVAQCWCSRGSGNYVHQRNKRRVCRGRPKHHLYSCWCAAQEMRLYVAWPVDLAMWNWADWTPPLMPTLVSASMGSGCLPTWRVRHLIALYVAGKMGPEEGAWLSTHSQLLIQTQAKVGVSCCGWSQWGWVKQEDYAGRGSLHLERSSRSGERSIAWFPIPRRDGVLSQYLRNELRI